MEQHDSGLDIMHSMMIEDSDVKDSLLAHSKNDEITYGTAIKDVLSRSLPAVSALLVRNLIYVINYTFIGRFEDSDFISGIGLGELITYVSFRSVAVGLSGGIDTLCSQAIGRNNKYLAATYYNSALIIVTGLYIFEFFIFLNSESIILALGQPEGSAKYASAYIIAYLPGLLFACHFEVLRKYLSCQGIYTIVLKVQVFTMIIHIVLLYTMVYVLKMQLYGVAIVNNITAVLNYVLTIFLTFEEAAFVKLEKEAFRKIREYLRFGVPAAIMTCLEFCFLEVVTLMAGLLGSDDQGACIILSHIEALSYMIPLGISFAAANLVGNNLGAGRPQAAKIYAFTVWGLSGIIGIIFTLILVEFRDQTASIFTNHEGVKMKIIDILPILAFTFIGSFILGSSSGTIRAMGKQDSAAYVTLFSLWIVALPSSYYLAFPMGMNQKGLWLGYTIGLIIIVVVYSYQVLASDWNKLGESVVDRLENGKDKSHDKDIHSNQV